MIELFVELWYIWLTIFIIGVIYAIRAGIKTYLSQLPNATLLAKLDPVKYKVINSLVVNIDGEELEMDHVVVSNYGVFLIEARHYQGFVLGEEDDEAWTQLLYSRREKIENPLLTNQKHIQKLNSLLPEYQGIINYISIAVFTADSMLKVIAKSDVIQTADLLKTVRKYKKETLTDEQKETIFSTLSSRNLWVEEEAESKEASEQTAE